jgi:hypothetical protein
MEGCMAAHTVRDALNALYVGLGTVVLRNSQSTPDEVRLPYIEKGQALLQVLEQETGYAGEEWREMRRLHGSCLLSEEAEKRYKEFVEFKEAALRR